MECIYQTLAVAILNVYVNNFQFMKKNPTISIEKLHLIAGFSLVLSGLLVYFIDGFEMALSWAIFGAMYISMSDIGEAEMSELKRKSTRHLIRTIFGYVGALLSLALLLFYLSKIILS